MHHYTEYKYWSIIHDHEMCRISGFDEQGLEHYLIIDTGTAWLKRRKAALERIQDHIEEGKEPGLVA